MDHFLRSSRNWLAGATVDRLAHRRLDDTWLNQTLAGSHGRLVVSWGSSNLFHRQAAGRPYWLPVSEYGHLLEQAESVTLLGEHGGHVYFGLALSDRQQDWVRSLPDAELQDIKDLGVTIDDADAEVLAYARGIAYWHRRHLFCGSCGHLTRSIEAGHQRQCLSPACGARHFPRTDPAVIVLVHHQDRCLLARNHDWPSKMYSVIAGFVEPGESLEQTVRRETVEETGLQVADIEYRSSQPWPFPSSLMLGFRARAIHDQINLGDDELEDAHWFSRQCLVEAVEAGRMRVPGAQSIAYRLVEEWFDAGQLGSLAELARRTVTQ